MDGCWPIEFHPAWRKSVSIQQIIITSVLWNLNWLHASVDSEARQRAKSSRQSINN
jgi:hypothetical protein